MSDATRAHLTAASVALHRAGDDAMSTMYREHMMDAARRLDLVGAPEIAARADALVDPIGEPEWDLRRLDDAVMALCPLRCSGASRERAP